MGAHPPTPSLLLLGTPSRLKSPSRSVSSVLRNRDEVLPGQICFLLFCLPFYLFSPLLKRLLLLDTKFQIDGYVLRQVKLLYC